MKDTQGRSLRVRFVDIDGSDIKVIRKRDGRKFTLNFKQLAESSQTKVIKWGQENLASKIEEELTSGKKVERDLQSSGDLPKFYYSRSKQEIKDGLREIEARPNPGFDRSSWEAITRLNSYRFLSGVDAEVALKDELNEKATAAAKVCEKNGRLSHDFGDYTDQCNLAMSSRGGLANSVDQYMEDSGANNREKRGHRRWCLFPKLSATGFGASGAYSAMHCFEHGSSALRESHAYPGKGFYPKEYLKGNGWSVYLTEKAPPAEKLEIEIYKLKQRPSKKIAAGDNPDGQFIGVQFTYTYGECIVFEPAKPIDQKGIYFVRITGGGLRESYITELY